MDLMFLLCVELARDALNSEGFCVIGGYMSPVNDAYNKMVCDMFPLEACNKTGNSYWFDGICGLCNRCVVLRS